MRFQHLKFFTVIFLFSFIFVSCNALQNLDGGDSCGDRDGDGLTDCEEVLIYFTSPDLLDSDGDGFSDFEEVREFDFNSDHDPYTFNPAIADVPIVQTVMITPPNIRLLFQDGSEKSVERSASSSNTVSTSETQTTSLEVEVGAEVSGTLTGTEVKASMSLTSGSEHSMTYTAEQSKENSTAVANTATTTFTGGKLAVALEIENPSNIAFTVTNLVMGGIALFPGRDQTMRPVGNLGLATVGFNGFTIGPGRKAGPLVFETDLDVGLTRELLGNSRGLSVSVAVEELQDADGVSFSLRETEILAKTAMVYIDYAFTDNRPLEKYNVATNTDPDGLNMTLKNVMEKALFVPVVNSLDIGLTDIRGVVANGTDKIWIGIHQTMEAGFEVTKVYDPREGYDFDAIEIFPGDFLRFIYMDDGDGDFIGVRQESIHGTDPTLADTDGDGMSDFEEIYTGWFDGFSGEKVYSSPTKADSDGDGVPDATEKSMGLNPTRADTDGDLVSDYAEINTFATDPLVNPTNQPWIAISAGQYHSLAIRDNGDPTIPGGTLWAWGNNESGELGTGDLIVRHNPTQIGVNNDWVAISGGSEFSLGIREGDPAISGGTLWSWGNNRDSRLGQGTPAPPLNCSINGVDFYSCLFLPTQVGTSTDWLKISAGLVHALGLRDEGALDDSLGSIWSWGTGRHGQLGRGEIELTSNIPVKIGSFTDWKDVATGAIHSLANNSADLIFLWGNNSYGQLANGSTTFASTPMGSGEAAYIYAGWHNSGAQNATQQPYVSGDNYFYQLGLSTRNNNVWNENPRLVALPQKGAMALTFGAVAVIAESPTPGQGKLYTWGRNVAGELGLGTTGASQWKESPVGSSDEWVSVSGKFHHFLALKKNGSLYSWGSNYQSQTGRGNPAVVGAILSTPGLVQ